MMETHVARASADVLWGSSRAMAVAAYTNFFRIYTLHPMDELHRQMAEGLPLNPISEERTFEVPGAFIVHMEFLYPSDITEDH